MKQITFGFSLSGGGLRNASAWTQALPRYGVHDIVLYNIFSKGYEVNDFVEQLRNLIQGQNGTINVMLTLDSAPYSEMTEAKRLSLPAKYQKACDYINRFAPVDEYLYLSMLSELIAKLSAKGLMPYVSWQLWQEPDSAKYFHGIFSDFVYWTDVKYNVVATTESPIYIGDFTSRKLNQDYRNYMVTDDIFDFPTVRYSTSLYPEVKSILTDYNANYPARNLPGAAITAYSIGTSTNKVRINSPMWMIRAVQMLQWAYDKPIDKIFLWKLVASDGEDGMYASHTHLVGGGWRTNPVWNMQLELIDVCKGGYAVTSNGIIGKSGKEIQITESDYVVH